MNYLKDFVSIIPLRGGSKGIPRKNLVEINDSPLFSYVTKASLQAGIRTCISTEDNEIKDICQSLFKSVEVIDRPSEIADDNSSTEDVISHFLTVESEAKHILLLQATSPLTTSKEILEAINLYKKNLEIPLLSVVNEHYFLWSENGKPTNYEPQTRPRRQDWKGVFRENGAIYIFSRRHFEKYRCRLAEECTLYNMARNQSFELDEEEDIKLLQILLNGK